MAVGFFLAEFLGGGRVTPLSRVMPDATRQPFRIDGVAADAYARPAFVPGPALVLVHGLAPDGKDDPRLVHAAQLLARTGFQVFVPTVPGLTRGRLRPEDVEPVVRTIAAVSERHGSHVALLGVSLGAGPALLASADPRVRDRVSAVVSLGGYASASDLVRFFLTGEYAFGKAGGHVTHDPALVRAFVAANADLIDADLERALTSGDRAAVARAVASLPPHTEHVLHVLSPERVARDITARLVLIHARGDHAVPYTESLRLAAARPERTAVIIVDVLQHVEGHAASGWSVARDLVRIWAAFYALLAGR
jgi:pimeloyl-ACP methyl ester carboxylesterase